MRISLLHATYRAGGKAVEVRHRWLSAAARPDRIEHVFAYNADDELSAGNEEIRRGVAGEPMPDAVTAVRNWNLAAGAATGDLLVVIADDLTPTCDGWDLELERVVGALEPRAVPFVVKVMDDSHPTEHLMRHPIVSRRFYEMHGLFDPAYEGIGVDNDFTLSAHLAGLVVDGRSIVWHHRHPLPGEAPTDSQRRMVSGRSATDGAALFRRRWPRWRRRIWFRYLPPASSRATIGFWRRTWRRLAARLGRLQPPKSWVARVTSARRRDTTAGGQG